MNCRVHELFTSLHHFTKHCLFVNALIMGLIFVWATQSSKIFTCPELPIYRKIMATDPDRRLYGFIPLMASCSYGEIGALNAVWVVPAVPLHPLSLERVPSPTTRIRHNSCRMAEKAS